MVGSKKFLFKVLVILFVVCAVMLLFANVFACRSTTVSAATESSNKNEAFYLEEVSEDAPEPRLFTNLSLSINGGDRAVWATVKNDFTLFSSTVIVIVELYFSETYHENYNDMELICIESTEDLDMGHTITARASTNGRQLYWQGRMRYKINNGSWKSKVTGTILCDANGGYIGML